MKKYDKGQKANESPEERRKRRKEQQEKDAENRRKKAEEREARRNKITPVSFKRSGAFCVLEDVTLYDAPEGINQKRHKKTKVKKIGLNHLIRKAEEEEAKREAEAEEARKEEFRKINRERRRIKRIKKLNKKPEPWRNQNRWDINEYGSAGSNYTYASKKKFRR